jgi:hypothetical protein
MIFNYSNTRVTVELRELLKMTDENGKPFNLWDFDYPSYYSGEEKKAFEQKVIDHYLFRQIGAETPARFKHNFKTRIREIMPYYIQMYKSVEIMDEIEDPFGNVDVTETYTETHSGTTTGSQSSESTGSSNTTTEGSTNANETFEGFEARELSENKVNKFSNTPQGEIEMIHTYMTEARMEDNVTDDNVNRNESVTKSNTDSSESNVTSSDSSSGQTSSTSEGTVTHTLNRKGNQGVNTYAHDMIEFRQSFINVDTMIIRELSDLFLQVY